jgi:Thrombospondin type 3 repeat
MKSLEYEKQGENRTRLSPLRFLITALLVVIPLTGAAQESPTVYEVTADPRGTYEVTTANETLELRMKSGEGTSAGVPCVPGAVGNDVCGFTLVLEAVDGMILEGFDKNSDPLLDLIAHADLEAGVVVINSARPLIPDPIILGTIELSPGLTSGKLRVGTKSEAVLASLNLHPVLPDTSLPLAIVPEPAWATALLIGFPALLLLARRRIRSDQTHDARAVGLIIPLLLSISVGAFVPSEGLAQVFTHQPTFLAAVDAAGGATERITFETIPTGLEGASFSNGTRIQQATFHATAPNLMGDVPLLFDGNPTGLTGTFLVRYLNPTRGNVAWPGGTTGGVQSAESDDDIRIEFDAPVRSAGVRIVQNILESGEIVRFEDRNGDTIASVEPEDGVGFRGYLIQTGDAPISAIVIEEAATGTDDIAIDDIFYDGGADTFADVVTDYQVADSGPPDFYPIASARIEADSLGAPDGQSVSLGDGGRIDVEFVDNSLTKSGDGRADLRIVETGALSEPILVEISANSTTWYDLGEVPGGTSEIDLDAAGVPNHVYRYVRITDKSEGEPPAPLIGADIDSVSALSGHLNAPDADDDHVYDVIDNCPTIHNPSQRDSRGNGVGDACRAAATIDLVRDMDPLQPGAELRLTCGSEPIERIVVGLWVPPGITSLDIGGGGAPGCGLPGGTLSGVISGPMPPGCSPATSLHANVNPSKSGAFLASDTTFSFRPDVKVIALYGQGAPTTPGDPPVLCEPGDPPITLLPIFMTGDANLAIGDTRIPSLDFTYSYLSNEPIVTADESTLVSGDAEAGLTSFTIPTSARVELRNRTCADTTLGGTTWSVWLDSLSIIHRMTLGLLGPESVAKSELYLVGCEPDRSCDTGTVSSGIGDLAFDLVDEAASLTQGPAEIPMLLDPTMLPDALYAPIEGAHITTGSHGVLNPQAHSSFSCIGDIENSAPAMAGAPPILIRDGLNVVNLYDDALAEPYQTLDGVIEELSGELVYEGISFNLSEDADLDGDGVHDESDNCPYTPNAPVIGDTQDNVCECGDAMPSDGTLAGDDLLAIRNYLVGLPPLDEDVPMLCSVSRDGNCDALDAVLLARHLDGLEVTLQQRCNAALPN